MTMQDIDNRIGYDEITRRKEQIINPITDPITNPITEQIIDQKTEQTASEKILWCFFLFPNMRAIKTGLIAIMNQSNNSNQKQYRANHIDCNN